MPRLVSLLLTAGFILINGIHATAQSYLGYHDWATCDVISGWAWDGNLPNMSITVDIYDGSTFIQSVYANQYRPDLYAAGFGNGYHGFSIATPSWLKNGATHWIYVKYGGTSILLNQTPKSILCNPPSYFGYHDEASCSVIRGWPWDASQPNTPISVDIYDGSTFVQSVVANIYRADLQAAGFGNGVHGFEVATPPIFKNGTTHSVVVKYGGTSLLLNQTPKSLTCNPPAYLGYHDAATCSAIGGWAWDANQPNTPISVDIYDNTTFVQSVVANIYRADLQAAGFGNGVHGFEIATPGVFLNGATHSVVVKYGGTSTLLNSTPKSLTCGSGTIPQTITTSPPGFSLTVDGAPCTSPCTFQWTPGSNHTIATTFRQTPYYFSYWSANVVPPLSGVGPHTIIASSSVPTYTANFVNNPLQALKNCIDQSSSATCMLANGTHTIDTPITVTGPT